MAVLHRPIAAPVADTLPDAAVPLSLAGNCHAAVAARAGLAAVTRSACLSLSARSPARNGDGRTAVACRRALTLLLARS
ncbi:MAG: hypothetical protein AAF677_17970 [Pseudomonadota bacterium]